MDGSSGRGVRLLGWWRRETGERQAGGLMTEEDKKTLLFIVLPAQLELLSTQRGFLAGVNSPHKI